MIWLSSQLAALAGLSFVLGVWQWVAGRRFPIHQRDRAGDFYPAISVLKPLKGCDSKTQECLESWFAHEYAGEVELLLGVVSEDDPVCEVVRKLFRKYPGRKGELVVANPVLGANAKVSSLCYLFKKARHEFLVISDADVFIQAGVFANLMEGLREESV